MNNIVGFSTAQPSQIEPFAIPTQNGLTMAKDVIESLRSQLSAVPLRGRAKVMETGPSTEQKFVEMATTATTRAYSALEDLSDQIVGVDCGSGEIYLNHYIALISNLPLLSDALALEGDHDRSWALKDVKNIQWAIEDEGRDLIKAIAPEIKRANEEYKKAYQAGAEAAKSIDPKRMLEAQMRLEEAIIHLKLIDRMRKQVVKLERIADRLSGPLGAVGEVLRDHAKQINAALEKRQTFYPNHLELGFLLIDLVHDHRHEQYIDQCVKSYRKESFIDFKRSMRPLFSFTDMQEYKKKVIEILAKEEGLSVDGYDYHAKNTLEMRKAYLFERMTPAERAKYKDLTSFDSEPKGSKFAWVFLGLQALVMFRGAGSLLLGYDAAALKTQADQMQAQLFNTIDPELKVEIEKDGARMGAILSDKWDALQRMGEGSMRSGLLNKLSPEAKEAIQGLLKGFKGVPTPDKIQTACDAVIASRLSKQIPSPFQHMSIGAWIDLFTRAEQEEVPATAAKVSEIAGRVAVDQSVSELSASFDKWGPGVDKQLLLHLGGREFGRASGLEGYNAQQMLSSIRTLLNNKLLVMADREDKLVYQKLSEKMGQALDLGRSFLSDGPIEFAAKLDKELARTSSGDSLFWQGGWTLPGDTSGHSIIYEIVKVAEDDFTFRVYNRGDGIEHHAHGHLGLKGMTLGLHEVIEVKKSKLLRPTVIQGLQELTRAPKEGEKWNPAELYYNILLRMEGKISNRFIPIDQTLPDIHVGICTYSSLAAFFHQFLGSNRRYERLMIELAAKAAWDYWRQNKASLGEDRQGRELLMRVAKQTIQDAIGIFSNEELDLIRSRMETIIAGVTRAERESLKALANRDILHVKIQAQPHELFFTTEKGAYDDLMSVEKVVAATKFQDVQLTTKTAKEVAQLLHKGNLESKAEFVRLTAHEYVGSLPLEIDVAEEESLDFVNDLVQIASEFQWSLHEVFTADPSRAYRLTIKDAFVPIKLLTIADSIARKSGLKLPQMLQRHMAIVLFGMTPYSRVDDPKLEDEIAKMCAYWREVDPEGIKDTLDTSFFNFEKAPAGHKGKKPIYVSENFAMSKRYLGDFDDREWPIIQWTTHYLNTHPEKLKILLEKQPFLKQASPTARAIAALADEYTATHPNATQPDPRFGKVDVERTNRLKGVLPDMFFHLWDLSFITNYLFTGGWNSDNIKAYNENKLEAIRNLYKEDRLLKRPTRHFKRERFDTEEGPLYVWKLDYHQYGHLSGDDAQESKSLYRPGPGLSKAYGEHDGSLLDFYGYKESERRRELPKERLLRKHNTHPRETVQKLFGLSSKADLQIEETLALFYSNPMLLAKWEYRDLLNYMLFEQGILLDEIRKRTPEEVSELIRTIAGLASKGHQYFTDLLGNVEVQAYLLDLIGKMKHYLKYAGTADDLTDPIPQLRKMLENPSLKNHQRTYIRYILAKHSSDLSDIITFAVQFDLHPLGKINEYYSAFDDEIRRDLNLKHRDKLHTALMGPSRDSILNQVLKAVMPHHTAKSWHPHGDFPLFQSDDGRITIDVPPIVI